MAKRTDRDYKKMCREAAKNNLMPTADGKWITAQGASGDHLIAGYRYGKFDHPRKSKEKKTGCCRGWLPGTTYKDN